MKPIFKRMLSGMLSVAIALSATPIVSAYAEKSEEHFTYSTDDYTVTYSVTNNWSCNYQGSVKIFNNSDRIIHNWSLAYVNDLETTQLWNASAEVYNSVNNLIHKVLAGDLLVDATEEDCEGNKNCIIQIMDQSPLLVAVKYYDE